MIATRRHRLGKSIGRRGTLLVLGGLAWVLMGVQIIRQPRFRFSGEDAPTALFLSIIDDPGWGWAWIVCGVAAVVIGLFRSTKPLCGRDDWGFNAMLTPVFVYTLFYGFSWASWLFSDGQYGQSDASYGLVVWGLISGFIITIAGWPEIGETQCESDNSNPARHRKPS